MIRVATRGFSFTPTVSGSGCVVPWLTAHGRGPIARAAMDEPGLSNTSIPDPRIFRRGSWVILKVPRPSPGKDPDLMVAREGIEPPTRGFSDRCHGS
jgi:hypothetical protein